MHLPSSSSDVRPIKRPRTLLQATMAQYTDRAFGEAQQKLATERLIYFMLRHNVSHNACTSQEMKDLVKVLRADFVIPCRRTLKTKIHSMFLEVKSRIEHKLAQAKQVSLAIDTWEDHSKQSVFGCTAFPLGCGGTPFLVDMRQVQEKQTAENMFLLDIKRVTEYLA